MRKNKVEVVQDKEDEVPVEIIAKSIRTISSAWEKMKRAGLKERTIILLLHDASKVGKSDIKKILQALSELKFLYLK